MSEPPINDPQATPPAPTPGIAPSDDDRLMAMLAHLLGIVTWIFGALIIWLVKKDQSAFVDDQGKEALNFQITMTLLWILGTVLGCLGVWVIWPAVWVIGLVFCIMGGLAANKGEQYRYPVAIRLVK